MNSLHKTRRRQAKVSRDSIKNLYFRLFLLVVFILSLLYLSSSFLISSLFTNEVRTKWYNEDLETVFGLRYLPFSIDDPTDERVSKILDAHDVRKDETYRNHYEAGYAKFSNILSRGPIPNDKRFYIAHAGTKGHGLFAEKVLKAGEFLAVYTGIHTLTENGQDSTYYWNYASKPLNEKRQEIYFNTDARVAGNMMRFVNDEPGSNDQNCRAIEVGSRFISKI
jgi:hypothetical protein